MSKIVDLLFETNAIRVCHEDSPFWYTSGKIGPFFINAQFLYGSEQDANDLLDFINAQLENEEKTKIARNVFEKVKAQYENNKIYKEVIDEFVSYINQNMNVSEIDYISGGERRDWFFSMMVAYLMKKPHVTVFKDVTAVESDYSFENNSLKGNLEGKNVLHIADLLNYGSSFIRAWIPAIDNLGGKLKWAMFAVDRNPEGGKALRDAGVENIALSTVGVELFETAAKAGKITENQFKFVKDFCEDDVGTMQKFLDEHPDFIKDSLNSSNEKTAKRAKLCVESHFYNI